MIAHRAQTLWHAIRVQCRARVRRVCLRSRAKPGQAQESSRRDRPRRSAPACYTFRSSERFPGRLALGDLSSEVVFARLAVDFEVRGEVLFGAKLDVSVILDPHDGDLDLLIGDVVRPSVLLTNLADPVKRHYRIPEAVHVVALCDQVFQTGLDRQGLLVGNPGSTGWRELNQRPVFVPKADEQTLRPIGGPGRDLHRAAE